jgi:hypothetical protein
VVFANLINAQTISPSLSNEYCPNTEITFTVTIPGTYQSIIGIGGCFVTQSPFNFSSSGSNVIFNFKGKFADANQAQTFSIAFTPVSGSSPFTATFKKIKSLFFSATSTTNPPCNVIKPTTPTTITAARCQIVNNTISFPNIQWFTNFENPEICFGTVTDYEYLLPAGWSIGSSVSNGSTWIAGGNSVTVTSDLATGDNVDIRIRASNKSCGTGLSANGPQTTIRISRPAPIMFITPSASLAFICAGSSKTFTLNGLPAGAVVTSWVSSNTSLATVPSPSTGSTVLVTPAGGGAGQFTLSANVTHCSFVYPPVTLTVTTGDPYTTIIGTYTTNGSNIKTITSYNQSAIGTVAAQYNWLTVNNSSINNITASLSGSSTATGFSSYYHGFSFNLAANKFATVNLVGTGNCGQVNNSVTFVQSGSFFAITASPNPASNTINVAITKVAGTSAAQLQPEALTSSSTGITKMYLYNFNTNVLVKQWAYQEMEISNYSLNIAGIKSGYYLLKMERDNKTTTTKILVQ